jgi:hypothetical protein
VYRSFKSWRPVAAKFDGLGDLTKALTFMPQRAACVAKCRFAEHLGLVHPSNAGDDFRSKQQATLLNQLGHFREVGVVTTEKLRSAVLGSLRDHRILRVHLLHGLFEGCYVIDHLKYLPAALVPMIESLSLRSMVRAA